MNKILTFLKRLYASISYKIKGFSGKHLSKKDKNFSQKLKSIKNKTRLNFLYKLSAHDKELFAKRLSYLLKAGVPLLQSLEMIKDQTRSEYQKKIIEGLISGVANGQTLSSSLKNYRSIYGDFIINVIRVGENSGLLHQNLEYLAVELKKSRVLKRKIISAFVYPVFIAIATIAITIFLITFIFPKILPVLKSLNVPLPLFTRILIGFSEFLTYHGAYLLLVGAILVVIAIFLSKIKGVRIIANNIIPAIPLIGQLLQNYQITNISRTLGMLLKSNVSLVDAIKIAAETTPNIVYKRILVNIGENIMKGKKMSGQFKNYPRFFPVLIPQMLSIGEATGNLGNSLLYLAEFYETEVEEMSKNLSNILEPLLMITMGIIVGSVVVSIITPIYGITQHLNVR